MSIDAQSLISSVHASECFRFGVQMSPNRLQTASKPVIDHPSVLKPNIAKSSHCPASSSLSLRTPSYPQFPGAARHLAYDWTFTPGVLEKPGSLVMASRKRSGARWAVGAVIGEGTGRVGERSCFWVGHGGKTHKESTIVTSKNATIDYSHTARSPYLVASEREPFESRCQEPRSSPNFLSGSWGAEHEHRIHVT